MMTLIADVLYLAAALAIFATVVLFVLSPMSVSYTHLRAHET